MQVLSVKNATFQRYMIGKLGFKIFKMDNVQSFILIKY